MKVMIPKAEAIAFAARMKAAEYREQERDYKDAVHQVISALLSPANMAREDFPSLIANVFKETIPDLDALGIPKSEQSRIKSGVASLSNKVRGAMANLAGGKWGLAQFAWIPRAIEFKLGGEFAQAFRELIDDAVPLAQRVETFRDRCDSISTELEKRGGFLANWSHFRVSASFVAVVLAGYDPTRYTFYAKGALRHGYEQYAPDVPWPKGTMGDVYAGVCEFVQAVAAELKRQGVPVRDLIDAQSFIWLSFGAAEAMEEPAKTEHEPTESTKPVAEKIDEATVAKDLAEAVSWPLGRAEQLVALLRRSRQLLFQGPPGTGKTFVAEQLARLLVGDDSRLRVVQFHPSYAYEDFVEGIRPIVNAKGDLAYDVRDGAFMSLAKQAREYPEERFFLIVDEINRANLPRVFGELLYALENRGPTHPFRLPYSQTDAYIPENVVLIATMNSADRSIALVDAAIRRRFCHVDFPPDTGVLVSWLRAHGQSKIADEAARRLDALNKALSELLDADRLIGHTYLMKEHLDAVGFATIWTEEIHPVLREHLYNRTDEIEKLKATFVGA